MQEESSFETTNINAKWLDNLFENLIKLENHERLARNGVQSTEQYMQLLNTYPPQTLKIILIDVQYKNLCNMIGEIIVTIKELDGLMEDEDLIHLNERVKIINDKIKDRKLFIDEQFSSASNKIVNANLTERYFKTLDIVGEMRATILKGLSHVRHAGTGKNKDIVLPRII